MVFSMYIRASILTLQEGNVNFRNVLNIHRIGEHYTPLLTEHEESSTVDTLGVLKDPKPRAAPDYGL